MPWFVNPAFGSLVSSLLEAPQDRKSTRLNSSHANISYAVFCLKKNTIFSLLLPFFSPSKARQPLVLSSHLRPSKHPPYTLSSSSLYLSASLHSHHSCAYVFAPF